MENTKKLLKNNTANVTKPKRKARSGGEKRYRRAMKALNVNVLPQNNQPNNQLTTDPFNFITTTKKYPNFIPNPLRVHTNTQLSQENTKKKLLTTTEDKSNYTRTEKKASIIEEAQSSEQVNDFDMLLRECERDRDLELDPKLYEICTQNWENVSNLLRHLSDFENSRKESWMFL